MPSFKLVLAVSFTLISIPAISQAASEAEIRVTYHGHGDRQTTSARTSQSNTVRLYTLAFDDATIPKDICYRGKVDDVVKLLGMMVKDENHEAAANSPSGHADDDVPFVKLVEVKKSHDGSLKIKFLQTDDRHDSQVFDHADKQSFKADKCD